MFKYCLECSKTIHPDHRRIIAGITEGMIRIEDRSNRLKEAEHVGHYVIKDSHIMSICKCDKIAKKRAATEMEILDLNIYELYNDWTDYAEIYLNLWFKK